MQRLLPATNVRAELKPSHTGESEQQNVKGIAHFGQAYAGGQIIVRCPAQDRIYHNRTTIYSDPRRAGELLIQETP